MRLLKTLALLALSCFTLVISAGVVAKHRIDSDWAELVARVDEAQAGAQARQAERSVLHGESGEGEAFAHYCRAIEMVLEDDNTGARTPSIAELIAATPEELERHTEAVRVAAPILRELRLGAQAPRAELELGWDGVAYDFGGGGELPALRMTTARRLSRVAFSAAATALAEGRSEVALGILLDSLQFARDLAATPTLSESESGADLLVPSWLADFGEEGGWTLFSEEELNRYIDALVTVDESLQTVNDAIRVDTILTVRDLNISMAELPCRPVLATVLKAQTRAGLEQLLDFEEQYLAAFESEPLRQPNRVKKKHERLSEDEGHDVELSLQRFGDATGSRLRGLADLRLLRLALSELVGRDDAPLVERLGLQLQSESVNGTHRVFFDTGCRNCSECKIGCPSIIELSVATEF